MKKVDLIIFDLDGTLVDSRQDIANAVNFTLRELGFPQKTVSEITSYVGNGVKELIERSLGDESEGLSEKALFLFEGYYAEHSSDYSELYPGVREMLEFFKAKRKIIVTNRNYEFAVLTLKLKGIYGYFEKIIGGDNVACMKPSGCPLDESMLSANASKDRTIMVGDMTVDVQAGKNAGVLTCGVTYGLGKREDLIQAKPDYIIDDISKLRDIIQ
ncbi:MAG: HAD-IA family hydrolase [bacterium]